MSKYTIGIDFGTESGRAVLVEVSNGSKVATAVYVYSHGVIDERLLDGGPLLEPDLALRYPIAKYGSSAPVKVKCAV